METYETRLAELVERYTASGLPKVKGWKRKLKAVVKRRFRRELVKRYTACGYRRWFGWEQKLTAAAKGRITWEAVAAWAQDEQARLAEEQRREERKRQREEPLRRIQEEMRRRMEEETRRREEEKRVAPLYRDALRAAGIPVASVRAREVSKAMSTGLQPEEAARKIAEEKQALAESIRKGVRHARDAMRRALARCTPEEAEKLKAEPSRRICKTTLKGRGWKDAEIARFLPPPDEVTNPNYSCAAPMLLWNLVDVVSAEWRRDRARERAKAKKSA